MNRGLFIRCAPLGLVLLMLGCPSSTLGPDCEGETDDCDARISSGTVVNGVRPPDSDSPQPIPRSTACAQIAFACFDELARQPADSIRFRPISRWPRTTLTWRLANRLPNLNQNRQLNVASEAFSRCVVVSTLIFKQIDNDTDITISFEQREHGDTFAFDGPGGVGGRIGPMGRANGRDSRQERALLL